jgi:putative alpha-1,2-mannosidase
VSCTLEYAYDDFAVAQMAKALGKARSRNNRNVYDARVGFMRGRKSDGSWIEPFDPLAWGGAGDSRDDRSQGGRYGPVSAR